MRILRPLFLWRPFVARATLIPSTFPGGHTAFGQGGPMHPTRRDFLEAAIGSGALLGGGLGFLAGLQPVSAQEAGISPSLLQWDEGIAPTLKLIEQTPRETLL